MTGISASSPGARQTVQAHTDGWLKIQSPTNRALVASNETFLGAGEAEAIALASEIGAGILLIDESDGRARAKALGLKVTGTLGVLLLAKQTGKLDSLKPVLDLIINKNQFRLAKNLYEQALRQVGEAP